MFIFENMNRLSVKKLNPLVRDAVLVGLMMCVATLSYSQNPPKNQLKKVKNRLSGDWAVELQSSQNVGKIVVDSIWIDKPNKELHIQWCKNYGYLPVREELIEHTQHLVHKKLPFRYRRYTQVHIVDNQTVSDLVPNFYRHNIETDSTRFPLVNAHRQNWVQRLDQPCFTSGLSGRNIALWPSHGRYFNVAENRWEWQRPRLFGTVEDLLPMTFTQSYLIPMLENAGANVVMPRERDFQKNEVVVDFDGSTGRSEIIVKGFDNKRFVKGGFAICDTLKEHDNPFIKGHYLELSGTSESGGEIQYIPDIPQSGEYAVYVAYASVKNVADKVKYTVYHSGGQTSFVVNQQIGGSTWVYLGTFRFAKGVDGNNGKVLMEVPSGFTGVVTADAVRFGGGMGSVARRSTPSTLYQQSGMPRCMEGARYYLQYVGMPDSLVYSFKGNQNDYVDDYTCRAEWVNYLMGAPGGPQKNRAAGLGIPIDMSIGIHTDAGTIASDSVIGTLAIFSTRKDTTFFPSHQSKMTNRDLADIVQTQLVGDLMQQVKPDWTRRGLWDKPYTEAWRPNVPSMLLELLSHQNVADMQRMLDPRFQFIAARAIYKGLLRYQAFQENRTPIVQPLPVDRFAIERAGDKAVKLSWRSVNDPLEPSAVPSGFKVYMATGEDGFDNGKLVNDTSLILELPEYRTLYRFRVTAINDGGESFPSETLVAGLVAGQQKSVLIVNAFDRLCAPPVVRNNDVAGFAYWDDKGVQRDVSLMNTGLQYDFNPRHLWTDNANAGCGASYGNMEGIAVHGNSFDFTAIHGDALLAAGESFVSMSDEAFEVRGADTLRYFAIDYMAGEERSTPALDKTKSVEFSLYTKAMRNQLSKYLGGGGHLFLSGAFVGSDIVLCGDTLATKFASQYLHVKWLGGHASLNGQVDAIEDTPALWQGRLTFNTHPSASIYDVEAPDAIVPADKSAQVVFRYHDTGYPACVVSNNCSKTVVMGFPFETIVDPARRIDLMKRVIAFFNTGD
jgi:hypothetical protein